MYIVVSNQVIPKQETTNIVFRNQTMLFSTPNLSINIPNKQHNKIQIITTHNKQNVFGFFFIFLLILFPTNVLYSA